MSASAPTNARINVASVIALLSVAAVPAAAQEQRTPLRNVAADQVVQKIAYCKGEYRVALASGAMRRFAEINLRFKTDSSAYGPDRDKPVLLPAGMRGDRAQVIFRSPDELKRLLVERCDAGNS